MQIYSPINNPLISYQFPEIKKILSEGIGPIDYYQRYLSMDRYRLTCMKWLQLGTHTKIKGLDDFPYVYAINGASQFINDLSKIENRKIVLHQNEYGAYHKILELYSYPVRVENSYSDMDQENPNEVIILSYPVSLNGNKDVGAENLIKNSKTPIILDSVFLGTNFFDVKLDLKNIETFVFSFSKSFGLAYNRIGILFSKREIPEYELYHMHGYLNVHSIHIAMKIMNSYNIDYFTENYKDVYNEACKRKECDVGDCILIGQRPSTEADKKVLITDIFDELINDLRKD